MRKGPLLLGLGVALVLLAHALYLACVAEDAYISFRYARHLVEGYGLVWNLGEPPVEGYSNFLWVLLSALLLLGGIDPSRGMPVLGFLASLATLVYVTRAALRQLGLGPWLALLPAGALALCGPFATWSVSGMETNAFSLFVVMALVHLADYWRSGRRVQLHLSGLGMLLAMLTRPEGVMLAAFLCSYCAAASRGLPRVARRDFAAPALWSLGTFALYFGWRWIYFGDPLPNTFYAKTGGGEGQVLRGLEYAGHFLLHFGVPWLPLLALGWLGRTASGPRELAARLRAQALPWLCLGWAALWFVYVVAVGGDYMAMYRFFVPALPGLALLLGRAADRALRSTGARWVGACLVLGALGMGIQSTPLEERLFDTPQRMHGNYRGVQRERASVSRLAAIGDLFAHYATGPEESLATPAIGVIGWRSEITVYGLHGLVDPELARLPGLEERIGRGPAGHGRMDYRHVLARRPTFFMFTEGLRATPPQRVGVPEALRNLVSPDYRLVSVWIEDFGNGEAGYFPFLERVDRRPPGRGAGPGAKPGH